MTVRSSSVFSSFYRGASCLKSPRFLVFKFPVPGTLSDRRKRGASNDAATTDRHMDNILHRTKLCQAFPKLQHRFTACQPQSTEPPLTLRISPVICLAQSDRRKQID